MLTTLLPRTKMVIDARALRDALGRGLKLTKVHRVLYSQQRAWVAEYINRNSAKRKEAILAKNEPLKELFKLMNNAVSGKLMENKDGRVNVEMVDRQMRHEHLASMPSYIDSVKTGVRVDMEENPQKSEADTRDYVEVERDIYMVRNRREMVDHNSAYAAAACMLDLAKMHAYKMIYEFQEAFRTAGCCDIMYHDTDSAVFLIEMKDHGMHPDVIISKMGAFDFSNMPKSSWLFDERRCGDVGLWKDETAGYHITEWIAPQPRSYCFAITPDDRLSPEAVEALRLKKGFAKGLVDTLDGFPIAVHVKAKGISSAAAKKYLTIERFRSRERTKTETTKIGVHLYRLFHEKVVRYMNFFDIKQFWKADGTSCPFGHYSISRTA